MHRDHRGLELTAAGAGAIEAFDGLVSAYLGMRTDVEARLDDVFAADPGMVLAHCLKGCFLMLGCDRKFDAAADACIAAAEASIAERGATVREKGHLAALRAWRAGDLVAAERAWAAILVAAPLDIVALRMAHYVHIYLGDALLLRDAPARAAHAWGPSVPDYGFFLSIRAFGLEEAGDYAEAEALSRQALAINGADIWSMHALAHVFEMEGRWRDGIAAVAAHEDGWTACNHFSYHIWWHRCLYHVELEEYGEALALYDARVRGERSDDYLDISNAASLLWRLEAEGVDAGGRWEELADKSARRTRDNLLAFVDVHYMVALAAGGRGEAAALLAAMEDAAGQRTTEAPVFAEVGVPLGRAIAAYHAGDFDATLEHLAPVRDRVWRIGGSHAQRDLFHQMLITAALQAGRFSEARSFLAERAGGRRQSPWNQRTLAAVLDGLGDGAGAAAARAEAKRLAAA